MIGCAGYKFQEVEIKLNSGQPEGAYTYLQKHAPKKPDIPHLFELGAAAHYASHFAESSAALERAAGIAEDRYTKSVSKELGSLVTSDKLRPYSATQYERLLTHYYSALNYVYLNQLDGALVECRRATNLINYFKNDEKYDFFGAAFLAHFSGMLFEATGEWNDALISYKQAEEYYKNAAEKTGVEMPPDIGNALVRLTRKLRFTDQFERYHNQYGEPPEHPENYGELILFYESGYVPQRTQAALTFPILKSDRIFKEKSDIDATKTLTNPKKVYAETKNAYAEDMKAYARTLARREGKVYDEVELVYILRIAIPTIGSHRPHFTGVEVAAVDKKARGVLVEDIESIAIETFKAQRPIILIRALVRALMKYLATSQAQKHGGEALGLLTNLAGVLTEQADTRSWQTLPNQIFMVRMPLPAGTHTLNFSFLQADGQVRGNQSVPDIKINPNQITFLNHRTYE